MKFSDITEIVWTAMMSFMYIIALLKAHRAEKKADTLYETMEIQKRIIDNLHGMQARQNNNYERVMDLLNELRKYLKMNRS